MRIMNEQAIVIWQRSLGGKRRYNYLVRQSLGRSLWAIQSQIQDVVNHYWIAAYHGSKDICTHLGVETHVWFESPNKVNDWFPPERESLFTSRHPDIRPCLSRYHDVHVRMRYSVLVTSTTSKSQKGKLYTATRNMWTEKSIIQRLIGGGEMHLKICTICVVIMCVTRGVASKVFKAAKIWVFFFRAPCSQKHTAIISLGWTPQ